MADIQCIAYFNIQKLLRESNLKWRLFLQPINSDTPCQRTSTFCSFLQLMDDAIIQLPVE